MDERNGINSPTDDTPDEHHRVCEIAVKAEEGHSYHTEATMTFDMKNDGAGAFTDAAVTPAIPYAP